MALGRRGSSDCSKGRLRRPEEQALERSSARRSRRAEGVPRTIEVSGGCKPSAGVTC